MKWGMEPRIKLGHAAVEADGADKKRKKILKKFVYWWLKRLFATLF
jgi:hypothetical protein